MNRSVVLRPAGPFEQESEEFVKSDLERNGGVRVVQCSLYTTLIILLLTLNRPSQWSSALAAARSSLCTLSAQR